MSTAAITIGGDGTFVFSAAHAGLHDGEFEPLHGHTFIVTLRLQGELDRAGMICDFTDAKAALAAAIEPLRRRVLMPAAPRGGRCTPEDEQILIECGVKRYSFPAGDMTLLPVANTTTESIAGWLLSQVTSRLHAPGFAAGRACSGRSTRHVGHRQRAPWASPVNAAPEPWSVKYTARALLGYLLEYGSPAQTLGRAWRYQARGTHGGPVTGPDCRSPGSLQTSACRAGHAVAAPPGRSG